MTITTGELTKLLNGKLTGDPHLNLEAPTKLDEGRNGTVGFLANEKYEGQIYTTKASCVIVSNDFKPSTPVPCALIRVEDVYQSLTKLLALFGVQKEVENIISKKAFVNKNAKIGDNVKIGHFSVINQNAKVRQNTLIHEQVYIGENVEIGQDCIIYPGVKIYHNCAIGNRVIIHSNTVIGSDGFGFAPNDNGEYDKMPQIGNVIIEDDVEIGSNTVIDRATMGSTIIHKGVKLDNLIQIAHNVTIDENTVVAAQTGIAGSTKIGKKCMIGGQVGFVGHITVADNVVIQAQSGVSSSIKEEGKKMYGYPAIGYQNYLRSYSAFKNFSHFTDRMLKMEKEIDYLKRKDL